MLKNNAHSGHRKRLRERFLSEKVFDHELLELILYYVRPVVNTNVMAHELLENFKSISGVLNADIDELQKVSGIGKESAVFFKVLLEGVCRYNDSKQNNILLDSYELLEKYFLDYFGNSNSELCTIAVMGSSMELLNTISLPLEQLIGGGVSKRDIIELLLKNNTYRIVTGINHIYGAKAPSPKDFAVISIFVELCKPLGIEIIDAVICIDDFSYSMRKHGAFSF